MTRLERVINDVKEARKVAKQNRPWIFDDNGKIKDNVFVAEVLDWLEDLKTFEIEATEEEIDYIVEHYDHAGNTYNFNGNTSNDINWHTLGNRTVIMIHLWGDIRCGYSEQFVIETEYDYEWMEIESAIQHKSIPGTSMVADLNLFSETYDVYDYDKNDSVGEFYDLELEDLLKSIEEARK